MISTKLKKPAEASVIEQLPADISVTSEQNTSDSDQTLLMEPVIVPREDIVIYPQLKDLAYITVDDDYFSDAVFIGDSRTVGLSLYGGLENISTFYAATGLTVYNLFDSPFVEIPGEKKGITVEQALTEHQFSKVYLMIGINEMGTGTLESFLEKYQEVTTHLKELQPDAILYLQGIMKVTQERSEKGDYITNEGIDARNAGIQALADNETIFYLDINSVLCDETGGLNSEYTNDGVHLKAKYISIWKTFLKEHAVDK